MNWQKLKDAEQWFLTTYPGGFEHPEMVEIGKKHKIDKLTARAAKVLATEAFENPEILSEEIIKTVTSSSMVSVFEKPSFRDFVRSLSAMERQRLTGHYYQLLHGDTAAGFTSLVDFFTPAKLAKWTITTVCPYYYSPQKELFVKPTTAKNVIRFFELKDLTYQPRPTWDFYRRYRDRILEMRERSSSLVGPDNAAFTGFLMLAMEQSGL